MAKMTVEIIVMRNRVEILRLEVNVYNFNLKVQQANLNTSLLQNIVINTTGGVRMLHIIAY